ncbi:MAG: cytosine permease [Pseudomonadota bacterium]
MAKLATLTEDYATAPVPEDKTYGGWRIGFVLGGIGIALPAFLSGAEVGVALGYEQSIIAFLAAAALVTTMAIASGMVGMKSRLSTYMILQFPFGRYGAKFVNAAFAIAQCGWFGVNAYFFGAAAESVGRQTLGLEAPSSVYIIAGGALMTLATIFGYKALDRIAMVVFPLMIATLAVMTARTFAETDLPTLSAIAGDGSLTFMQSMTVLAGGIIVGVLLVPDLTRYARRPVDVVIAAVIALTIIETLVHAAASGAAILFTELDPLALMLALGFGSFAFIFLIAASVTTNAVNLYGSGLALTSIFPGGKEWAFVVMTGVVGSLAAIFEISAFFIDFLVWQSVIFSSVLGVYLIDFFFVNGQDYRLERLDGAPPVRASALFAWGVGAATAAAAFTEQWTFTSIPNLDGVIAGGGAYFVLRRVLGEKREALS